MAPGCKNGATSTKGGSHDLCRLQNQDVGNAGDGFIKPDLALSTMPYEDPGGSIQESPSGNVCVQVGRDGRMGKGVCVSPDGLDM